MQETFLKAWEYVQSGQEVKNQKAFIYHIANNLIIDEYRKKKSLSLDDLQEQGFDVANHDERDIVTNVEISQVKKALTQLPEKYRQVVVMRYIDGLSLTEIASTTGQSENAVSVQLNRAVKMLQNIIRP
jgi:RNA polymerase sigma-70 factor (ECF subfamily)